HPQDGRVVSNFIMQALENKNITIFGDGTQTRSFCYVDDLIKGLISMMETNKSITGPINLGNPNEFSMNQLAREVIKITNSKSKIEYKELPQDDPRKRQPDITLAKSKLNWEPRIELEEGLKKTIDYFKIN
ncbi:GDP-mannose 4,6-dehydratase, partial [Methylophilaceae bacterium]|nr:GDP-mannose 4,6-dehydratase [Methylophilaceae bacterium]